MYMSNYYKAIAHFLGEGVAVKLLTKLLSVYKTRTYVDIYSLLRWIFYCVCLLYNYRHNRAGVQKSPTYVSYHRS